jgi:hypothetical protein
MSMADDIINEVRLRSGLTALEITVSIFRRARSFWFSLAK